MKLLLLTIDERRPERIWIGRERLHTHFFMLDVEWVDIRTGLKNCTEAHCPLEEMVWRYARRNLALLNIFIKVEIDHEISCF